MAQSDPNKQQTLYQIKNTRVFRKESFIVLHFYFLPLFLPGLEVDKLCILLEAFLAAVQLRHLDMFFKALANNSYTHLNHQQMLPSG